MTLRRHFAAGLLTVMSMQSSNVTTEVSVTDRAHVLPIGHWVFIIAVINLFRNGNHAEDSTSICVMHPKLMVRNCLEKLVYNFNSVFTIDAIRPTQQRQTNRLRERSLDVY